MQALCEKHYTQSNSMPTRIPRAREIVMVAQGPKNEWSLEKIEELVQGLDGAIREVKVKTKGSICRKTIDKLISMELQAPVKGLESAFDSDIQGDPGNDTEVNYQNLWLRERLILLLISQRNGKLNLGDWQLLKADIVS